MSRPPGATDGVPGEACGPVRRPALVDHTGGHPARPAATGTTGVPTLEGKDHTRIFFLHALFESTNT